MSIYTNMILVLLLIGVLSGLLLGAYFAHRNYLVYSVRMFFLSEDNNLFPTPYDKLPSYHDMLYKLKYQKLKTPEQWVAWTKTQL